MAAGIRQGCPSSGSIFVLLLDPWIRMVLSRLPRALPFGFVDDVALVMNEFFDDVVDLFLLLMLLEGAACLTLNMKKVVVVPLRPAADLLCWRQRLEQLCPSWRSCQLQRSAKYLGIYIGSDYDAFIWIASVTKFRQRVQAVASLAGSWTSQVPCYRVCALSVLSHVMQFARPPPTLMVDEAGFIAKVSSCLVRRSRMRLPSTSSSSASRRCHQ